MTTREIELKSIKEPWFNDQAITPKELLIKLFEFSEQLYTPTTRRSTRTSKRKTPKALKIAERVTLATELIAKKMTVAQACLLAGCSISSYYAHRNNL